MKKYAISDIHCCLETFKKLLQKIKYSKQDELYILGDLIDRGPSSKGVIDYIFELKAQGFKVECTRGNHEQMMLDGIYDLDKRRRWLINGGSNTVESFNVNDLKEIP